MPDRDLIPTPEEFERTRPKKKNFIARLVGRLRVKPGVGEEAQRVSAPPPATVPQDADEQLRLEEERESARRREREEAPSSAEAQRLAEEQGATEARKAAEQRRLAEERRAAEKLKQGEARKAAVAKRRAEAERAAAAAAEAERMAKTAAPAAATRPARRITFREGVARPTQTHRGSVQPQTSSNPPESKRSTNDD